MGGSIGVTVREENGKEHRMCRWTNTLPWFVNNIRLINKDLAHLQKYLATWYGMRKDYERHKADGKFEQNMTSCYAPYPFLAPDDYGLMVVDMLSNKILDYNGYTSAGSIASVFIASDMSSTSPGMHTFVFGDKQPEELGNKAFYLDDESMATRFRELLEAGRIKEARDYRNHIKISLDGKTLDEAIQIVKKDKWHYLDFLIDMSPFEIINYKERDPDEAERIRANVKELGFVLSDEEEKIWDKWINDKRSR